MHPVPVRLVDPTAAASGDNTLYTPSEQHRALLQTVTMLNTAASKVTVKVGINSTANASLVFPSVGIPAGGMVERDTKRYLTDADSLLLNCSATGVTVTVDGIDFYPRV